MEDLSVRSIESYVAEIYLCSSRIGIFKLDIGNQKCIWGEDPAVAIIAHDAFERSELRLPDFVDLTRDVPCWHRTPRVQDVETDQRYECSGF